MTICAADTQTTHRNQKDTFLITHGDSVTDLDFTTTKQSGTITQKGGSDYTGPCLDDGGEDMDITAANKYRMYAEKYNRDLQEGIGQCAKDLYLMAAALREEGRRHDELKALMLSFYCDLSGVGSEPAVNRDAAKRAAETVAECGIDRYEMAQLYVDTIRKDTVPTPIMSVKDSLYIFEVSIDGGFDEAEAILRRFTDSTAR